MTIDEARKLMNEWTASPALRIHMESVAACMGAYADELQPDERDRWIVCGLLHDMDYERHPTPAEHPTVGVEHLRTLGVDDEICTAILGHAEYLNVARETPMARTLFAVDELAGFIVACCKVRPNGIADLEPSSVRKKLKDKAFAAAVSRDDIRKGIAEMGLEESAHIRKCIDALRAQRETLGI